MPASEAGQSDGRESDENGRRSPHLAPGKHEGRSAVRTVDPSLREPEPSSLMSLREALRVERGKRVGCRSQVKYGEQNLALPAAPPHPLFRASTPTTQIHVPVQQIAPFQQVAIPIAALRGATAGSELDQTLRLVHAPVPSLGPDRVRQSASSFADDLRVRVGVPARGRKEPSPVGKGNEERKALLNLLSTGRPARFPADPVGAATLGWIP